MAVDIQFNGLGEPLLESIKKQRDALAQMDQQVTKTNANIQQGAQQSVQSYEALDTALVDVAKTASVIGQQSGAGKLAKDSAAASANADDLATALGKAQFAAIALQKQQQQIRAESNRITDAASKGLIPQAEAVKKVGQLAKEYVEVTAQLEQVRTLVEQGTASITAQPEAVKSLKTQLTEAKNEAAQMIAQFGEFSPEAIEATKRAAALKDQIGDLNKRLDALNPDSKFAAFGQVAQSITGGFTAAQGALALFGTESEAVQRGLLKVQGALAITQGLQAFFENFGDGLKNIRTLLGLETVAQQASTVAIEADTVSKEANIVVTEAQTAASTGLVAALNAVKVAALENPFTALLVAGAALVTLFILLTDDTKDFTKEIEDLEKKLDDLSDSAFFQIDFTKRLKDIQSENALINEGGTIAAKRAKLDRDLANEQDQIEQRRKVIQAERLSLEGEILQVVLERNKAFADGDFKAVEKFNENLKELTKGLEDRNREIEKGDQDLKASQLKAIGDRAQLDKDQLEQDRKNAEERKAIREKLITDLAALEEQLTQKIQAAQLQGADPRDRIRLEQQAANAEIEQIRTSLLRKLAEQQIASQLTSEQFKALSEQELKVKEDALIAEQKVRLSPQQEEQFQTLRFLAAQEGEKKLSELLINEARVRIDAIANANDREVAVFEIGLQERIEALRKAGVDEQAVIAFEDSQRAQFTQQRKAKVIDQEEQIAVAQIDAKLAGAKEDERLTRELELRKLDIQEAFAEERLKNIVDDGTLESEAQKAVLEKTIADIEAARTKLANTPIKFNLLDLLGIKKEDQAAVEQNLQSILGSVTTIIDQSIAIRQQEVDAQISATDQIIEDAQRRRDELQAQLEQEQADQAKGLANNVDSVQAAIATQSALEQQALAEKKRLVAERQKLARQQAIADSISQVSSLGTAAASLFADGATKGIPGVIAAIAFAATLIATFLSIKAKIRAATADTPTFRKGGAQMLRGPSHEQGGIGLYNERTGKRLAEAEGGEAVFFVRREHAATHMPLLEAINENDMARTARLAIQELTQGQGIQLEPHVVREIVQQKERLQHVTQVVNIESNKDLQRSVRELTEEVRGFRKDAGDKPEEHHLNDGTRILAKKAVSRIDRKKK